MIKEKSNTKLFYTPKDGTITIRINKDSTIEADVFVE
jgi:beta-lactamase superfamily II metal-dependent hydrolase